MIPQLRGPKPKTFGTEKVLAYRFGLIHDYFNFEAGNELTHGAAHALKLRVRRLDSRIEFYADSHPTLLDITSEFAARAALRARRAIGEVFGWPEPPELGPLLDSIAVPRKPGRD